MKLSTATSVLLNYRLRDAVGHALELDLQGIDLWCGRPHLYRGDYSDEELSGLAQTIRRRSKQVVSVMPAFFRYPFSLSSMVPAIVEDSVSYMKSCIDYGVLMGAQHVLVVPTMAMKGQTDREARRVFLSSLEPVVEYAQARRMKLAIEPVYGKLCGYMCRAAHVRQIIGELQTDLVGAVIDTGHIELSEETFYQAFETLGDLVCQVHVNDNNGREQQNNIPGQGVVDFPGIISFLRRSGYGGFLTLELGWHYSFDPLPALNRSISALRGWEGNCS